MRNAMRKMTGIVLGLALLFGGVQAVRAAECSEGTKVADECLGYTYEGCCGANEETYWCDSETGPTCMYACADDSTVCGWKNGYYGCTETVSEDPTGTFPYSCVTCDPACEAGQYCDMNATCQTCSCGTKQCGSDQCGVSCGTCPEGQICTDSFTCEVPPQCTELEVAVCDDVKTGDTTGGTSLFESWECGGGYDESGPEAAYKFVATADDMLLIKLDPIDFDVYVTEGLCAEQSCVAAGYGELNVPVEAGHTYWIVVEGYGGYIGTYNLVVGCQSTCVPNCTDKTCGDDGCGGTCGECATGMCTNDVCYDTDGCVPQEAAGCPGCACEACVCALDAYCCSTAWDSMCQGECLTDCQGCGFAAACGDGKCLGAETCSNCAADCACAAGSVCLEGGTCCTPDCTDKNCGDDGCGGSCGTCAENEICNGSQQCEVCFPSCDGKVCGDNGCGGVCGTCDDGFGCSLAGQCVESKFECLGNSAPSADDCMGSTYEGCCDEMGRLIWCQDGKLYCVDCAGSSVTCGWNATGLYYDCSQEGEDPSGANPLECDLKVCDPACPAGQICQAGVCVDCTADCTGKECGDDGCGGSCGTCNGTDTCSAEGQCVPAGTITECKGPSEPSATACGDVSEVGCCDDQGRALWCQGGALYCSDCAQAGDSTMCGWSATYSYYDCGTDGTADPSGANPIACPVAACVPDCTGKVCGDDGCDGECGTCGAGETCNAGVCEPEACVPDCTGKVCGDDGCGTSCGTCNAGETCNAGVCEPEACVPDCTGKTCGDDGCGNVCGTCLGGEECVSGVCQKIAQDVVSEDVPENTDVTVQDVSTTDTTPVDNGGGSSGGCTATTEGNSGAALLMALMLLALAGVRSYRKN